MIRLISQCFLEFGKGIGLGEVHLIAFRFGIMGKKIPVSNYFWIVSCTRKNTGHISAYGGSTEIFENADPLVSLLNIELPEKFIAGNGITNTGITQMRHAQASPFEAKFTVNRKQRHKIRSERIRAALRFCANDLIHRNFDHPKIDFTSGRVVQKDLIQNRQICRLSGMNMLSMLLLSGFQGTQIMLFSF